MHVLYKLVNISRRGNGIQNNGKETRYKASRVNETLPCRANKRPRYESQRITRTRRG